MPGRLQPSSIAARLCVGLCLLMCSPGLIFGQSARLEGHGGPIMALAVAPDTGALASGSFDYAAGLWNIRNETHRHWLDGHEAAVNHVLFVDDERLASASDDFSIMLWDVASQAALYRLEGHQNKVMGIAVSRTQKLMATASWDRTIRLWALETGEYLGSLEGHQSGVNDLAFIHDDTQLLSVSADGTLRLWDVASQSLVRIVRSHGFGINELLVDPEGHWAAYGAVDGVVRVMNLDHDTELADLSGERRPILALALSPDRARLAIGDGEGYIMIVNTNDWRVERDFRAVARGPVWALAFAASDRLFSGGLDDAILVWDLAEPQTMAAVETEDRRFHRDPEAMENGERQFARKCSICHTLRGDTARRAGPSLEGLFGRRAGSISGYAYSPAIRDSGIIWNAETINSLFDEGPDHYTPGSKMPMQRITDPDDRADLIAYLKEATKTSKEDSP